MDINYQSNNESESTQAAYIARISSVFSADSFIQPRKYCQRQMESAASHRNGHNIDQSASVGDSNVDGILEADGRGFWDKNLHNFISDNHFDGASDSDIFCRGHEKALDWGDNWTLAGDYQQAWEMQCFIWFNLELASNMHSAHGCLSLLGCESSKESFENYQNVEGSHTHLTQILFKLACLLVGSAYASALLFPISYAIFQFPDPIYWRLPMDVQWVFDRNRYLLGKSRISTNSPYFLHFFSSLIGWSYTGFLIDWFIQFIAFTCYFSILVASGSLFIGLCLYITGMVEDIKLQLALLDEPLSTKNSVSRLHARSVYAKEIDFHINILECVSLLISFWFDTYFQS